MNVEMDLHKPGKQENNVSGDESDSFLKIEDLPLHLAIKQEIDAAGNKYDDNIDMKVENPPIQLEIKQENVYQNKLFVEKSQNISCTSPELSRKINRQKNEKQNQLPTKKVNKINCQNCDYSSVNNLISESYLKTPMHGKTYKCCHYGTSFTHKKDLVKHLKTPNGEKPYTCSNCDKWFILEEKLAVHQKIHTEKSLYPGPSTEISGPGANLLIRTPLITASPSRRPCPYQCNLCGDGFTMKSSLVSHQRKHIRTVDKPYKCSQCGKCFIKQEYLIAHQRTHTGEKPYQCSCCKMSFKLKINLEVHQIRHLTYTCSFCGESFRQVYNMIAHRRKHHVVVAKKV